ncbi:MAG: ferritin-like domain-containing protein, partial [Pseudomonadota bacterium]
ETLECDLAAEQEARAMYKEASEYCREAGDYVTMELFKELLEDEESHIDFLETQLDLHERVGPENYAQLNASKMDEAE